MQSCKSYNPVNPDSDNVMENTQFSEQQLFEEPEAFMINRILK
jgi:hypothetical protein